MLKNTLTLLSKVPASLTPQPHTLCGFLAGLHSHGPDASFKSFDDAYEVSSDGATWTSKMFAMMNRSTKTKANIYLPIALLPFLLRSS
jgi:hypothetical protein